MADSFIYQNWTSAFGGENVQGWPMMMQAIKFYQYVMLAVKLD